MIREASNLLQIPQPLESYVVCRLNRFVVRVRVDGDYKRAYINNTGRLEQFLVPGRKGFCALHERSASTDHRLVALEDGDYGALIDTQWQMRAFEAAVGRGLIPWLGGRSIARRNARLGNYLIDYLLTGDIYLEVKSAVLREALCGVSRLPYFAREEACTGAH